MTAIEQVLYIIPVLALAASITYYAMVIRNQNQTRRAQLFIQIYDKFNDYDYERRRRHALMREWENYDDYLDKYAYSVNPEYANDTTYIWRSYEGLGVLVEEGMLDPSIVAKFVSSDVILWWEKFGSIIVEMRERSGFSRIYDKTEYLYNQMKSLRDEEITSDWYLKREQTI